MKWSTHINNICKKANSSIGFLRRNLRHCPTSCRKNAYLALVRSKLEYGCTIWDPFTKSETEKIEKIQRKAARFITNDYRSRSAGCVTSMLEQLELPSLQDRRKQLRLTFMYKVVEGLVPAINIREYLSPQGNRRSIRTRKYKDYISDNIVERSVCNNSKCYKPVFANTLNFKNSFFVRTVIDWNKLSEEQVNATSIDSFKNRISFCD